MIFLRWRLWGLRSLGREEEASPTKGALHFASRSGLSGHGDCDLSDLSSRFYQQCPVDAVLGLEGLIVILSTLDLSVGFTFIFVIFAAGAAVAEVCSTL